MKLIKTLQHEILLEVETTGDETKEFYFPKEHVYYWYPFNLNFFYRYTDSKEFLYLVKEKGYEGPNYYNVDILKRTRPLDKKHGVMFNPEVYSRNFRIMNKAANLGLPTPMVDYTMEDIMKGFKDLSNIISVVKEQIEMRYMTETGELFSLQSILNEEWDEAVYSYMSPFEQEVFIEFGEMYCMLSLMRKLCSH